MARIYELSASEREDGSTYYTVPTLPGFHFILAPGEDIQRTLIPAFKQFLGLSLRMATPTIRQRERDHRAQRFTAELEFA